MIVLHFDLVINLFYFVQTVKKLKQGNIFRKYKTVLLKQRCLHLTSGLYNINTFVHLLFIKSLGFSGIVCLFQGPGMWEMH